MAATETLGKYRILATLGHGGMGEVFLAAQQGPAGFNKLVVVKAMRPHVAGDERFKQMLLDEARLAARLRHPNVVQTTEVGDVDGRPLIAMEYLEGQPLNVILGALRDKNEQLGVGLATRIVCDALAGLHYAHELADFDGQPLNIVHRDVSPHNIFVTYEGEVKLLDFGIAKATTNVAETEVGTVKGKIAYMAPEQARGLPLDRRADVFAIGLVLWESLTSRRMLEGDSTAAILDHLLHRPLPPVSELCPDIDPKLAAVVARAVEKSADARYPSAGEMRQALLPFARDTEREELGKKISSMFEKERRELAAKIKDSMRPPRVDDGSTRTINIATGEIIGLEPDGTAVKSATGSRALQQTPPPSALTTAEGRAAPPPKRRLLPWIAVGVVVGAGAIFFLRQRLVGGTAAVDRAANADAGAAAPVASAEVVLRLAGSDTVGKELAPALVEAFLARQGASAVTREPDDAHHRLRVLGKFSTAPLSRAIDIASAGSAVAFAGLASGECEVGMSSRRPTADEIARVKDGGFGDPTGRSSEHIVALDGVAVIVSADNPVRSLAQTDVTRLFSGNGADWASAGGRAGPVHLYVRDDKSGTGDALKHFLGLDAFAPGAKTLSDNQAVSDAVAGDPLGLGFVGMAYVRNAKSVALSAPGIAARQPTPFTVTTESYLLSRRLYLYTAEHPKSATTADFVRFVSSPEGQKAVRGAGFVALALSIEPPLPCEGKCPPRYAALTKNAHRVSFDFRFRDGTTELDNRGVADLERLVAFLGEHPGRLALIGFSDASAADSLDCAKAVSSLLHDRGVGSTTVDGLGSAMPLAPASPTRNRRVEVWLQDAPAGAGGGTGAAGTVKPTEIRQTR